MQFVYHLKQQRQRAVWSKDFSHTVWYSLSQNYRSRDGDWVIVMYKTQTTYFLVWERLDCLPNKITLAQIMRVQDPNDPPKDSVS